MSGIKLLSQTKPDEFFLKGLKEGSFNRVEIYSSEVNQEGDTSEERICSRIEVIKRKKSFMWILYDTMGLSPRDSFYHLLSDYEKETRIDVVGCCNNPATLNYDSLNQITGLYRIVNNDTLARIDYSYNSTRQLSVMSESRPAWKIIHKFEYSDDGNISQAYVYFYEGTSLIGLSIVRYKFYKT